MLKIETWPMRHGPRSRVYCDFFHFLEVFFKKAVKMLLKKHAVKVEFSFRVHDRILCILYLVRQLDHSDFKFEI